MLEEKKKKGFSLIEMLAVIALLGILSIIGIAVYTGVTKKIKAKSFENIQTELAIAAEKYTAKTGQELVSVTDLIDAGYLTKSGDSFTDADGNNLECVYIQNGELYYYNNYNELTSFSSGSTCEYAGNQHDEAELYTILVYNQETLNNDRLSPLNNTNWVQADNLYVVVKKLNTTEIPFSSRCATIKNKYYQKNSLGGYDGMWNQNCELSADNYSIVIPKAANINATENTNGIYNLSNINDYLSSKVISNVEGDLTINFALKSNSDYQETHSINVKIDNTAPYIEESYLQTLKSNQSSLDTDKCALKQVKVNDDLSKFNSGNSTTGWYDPTRNKVYASKNEYTNILTDLAGNTVDTSDLEEQNVNVIVKGLRTIALQRYEYIQNGDTYSDVNKKIEYTEYTESNLDYKGLYTDESYKTKISDSSVVINIDNCTLTVYAKYEAKLTYDPGEGIGCDSDRETITGVYDKPWSESMSDGLCTPTPPAGKKFVGWYDKSGNEITEATDLGVVKENIKLTAYYEPNTATLTYTDTVGSGCNPSTLTGTYGQTWQTALNGASQCTPTASGKKFTGWINKDTNEKFEYSDTITGDVTLVAQYQSLHQIIYSVSNQQLRQTVNNKTQYCTVSSTPTSSSGDEIVTDVVPTCTSSLYSSDPFVFKYWQDSSGKQYNAGDYVDISNGDVTLTAKFENREYYINYKNPKNASNNQKIYYVKGTEARIIEGGNYASLNRYANDNFKFLYWENEDNAGGSETYNYNDIYTKEEDITLTAKYYRKYYDVYRYDYTVGNKFSEYATQLLDMIINGVKKVVSIIFKSIGLTDMANSINNIADSDLYAYVENACTGNASCYSSTQTAKPYLEQQAVGSKFTIRTKPSDTDNFEFLYWHDSTNIQNVNYNEDTTNGKGTDVFLWAQYKNLQKNDQIQNIAVDSSEISRTEDTTSDTEYATVTKYTITYKSGSTTIATTSYEDGTSIKIRSVLDHNTYNMKNYGFVNWSCDDGTTKYAGSSYTIDRNIVCTANWYNVCGCDKNNQSGIGTTACSNNYSLGAIGNSYILFDISESNSNGNKAPYGTACQTSSGSSYSGQWAYNRLCNTSLCEDIKINSKNSISGMSAAEINTEFSCNYHKYWCK